MAYSRGSNPIWLLADLVGNLLDDTYYMFVLQNTIPYAPAAIFSDADATIPLANPVQVLANGTLPIDIYFDDDVTYRLEFRAGNTQADQLIYLVQNYNPASGGSTPITGFAFPTDNQFTNPQFALVNFDTPYVLTSLTSPSPIEFAPGWSLNLTGAGDVTFTLIKLNSADANATNAPYAVRITLSGTWTNAYVSQRFSQSGMIWSGEYVSTSIMARINGANELISAALYDSLGTPLKSVLDSTTVNTVFESYTGVGLIPASVNTDLPPSAYVEYRLAISNSADITITSLQLIASAQEFKYEYSEDTVQRQIDNTWHYYRDSVLRQPKASLLTGWDFALNPWQFTVKTVLNLATFGYTADQTIVIQQEYVANANGNNISTQQAAVASNYGFQVNSVTATNKFALVQFIDPATVRPHWGSTLSGFVNLTAQKKGTGSLPLKMRLLYRSSLPPTLSRVEPMASWDVAGEPVYASGWTAVSPKNYLEYNVINGSNTYVYEGFDLPASDNANMTLAIILYTSASMDSSGTPDNIIFNRVSLVDNDFAIDCNALSFDETLIRCQYYYQKSFAVGTLPASSAGAINAYTGTNGVVGNVINTAGPQIRFPVEMRAIPTTALYNPLAVGSMVYNLTTGASWIVTGASNTGQRGFYISGTPDSGSKTGNGTAIHWTASARLGL